MGRYRSDDSDDDYSRNSKKKKKRRQRSRTRSGSESEASSHVSSKWKKSKKSHRRSPSGDRRRKRSRSRSPERRHRRSRSGSRSPFASSSRRSGRSRSPARRRKSRSTSPSRGSRRRTRSRSREKKSRNSRGDSNSVASPANVALINLSLSDKIPNPALNLLTPSEQAEERMRLALKAAAAADQKLKQAGIETATNSGLLSNLDTTSFSNSVASIEACGFTQSSFKSSRSTKVKEESPMPQLVGHDDAIFGSLAMTGFTIKPDPEGIPQKLDPETIAHPSLFVDPAEKMDRWILRLGQLRRKKLEGEAML